MWRSLRLALPNTKISIKQPLHQKSYSTSASSGGTGKVIFGIVASTGLGFAGAIAYGKYEPKFKSLLEANVPFVDRIYKMFPDDSAKSPVTQKDDLIEKKIKDTEKGSAPSLLKKKLDREKASVSEVPKPPLEKSKTSAAGQSKDDKLIDESNILKTESKAPEPAFKSAQMKGDALHENALNDTISKLKKMSEETMNVHKNAAVAIKTYTEKLYEALDLSEGNSGDMLWKEANNARVEKEKVLTLAKKKASETRKVIEKLNNDAKKLSEHDATNPLIRDGEEMASKYLSELQKVETEVATAEKEAKTATEYEQLVKMSKEQFRKELQIVLPNYLQGDKTITEGDLNLLIAHAHRRIEQLQKQIAKLQVTEKIRVDEAVKTQKKQDEILTESMIEAEMKKRRLDLESAVENRVASLKAEFEAELHKQLLRQAAAHADHLQEALRIQEQELERKQVLELEEKLLHQKGVFISETSGNMARLKGIIEYLKTKAEFDESSKKAQALWLACQAMDYKITQDKTGSLSPLAKDIAALKLAADEDNEFLNSVVASIPTTAVNRGVFTNEVLKQRFEKVKNVCKKVALVDENNDSLYRYFLSYLQSLLIIESASIPKEELDGKVAVDTSEWDTFDILQRISYCLKIDDLEQALRYANQLKGEPKTVAKDWMSEVKLLLETQLAVKALLAHAAAVGVQAYH